MTTLKRKIKRKFGTHAELISGGGEGLLLSQWGLAEDTNQIVLRKSDGNYINITADEAGGLGGGGINNLLVSATPQPTASFNISGSGRIVGDLFLGVSGFSSTPQQISTNSSKLSLINAGGDIELTANSGDIIMSGDSIRMVQNGGDPGTHSVGSAKLGSMYYNVSTNKLRLFDNTGWIDVGGGGGGFTNPMTSVGDLIRGGSSGSAIRLGIGATGDVLAVVGGIPTWVAPSGGGGGGDITDGTNAGTGSEVFQSKVLTQLVFRTLVASSNKITITQNANTISFDVNESNLTLDNIGGTLSVSNGGTGLSTNGTSGQVLTWDSGAPAWITPSGGGGGEANTASNLATFLAPLAGSTNTNTPIDYGIDDGISNIGSYVYGLYAGKIGIDLQFRSLQYYSGSGIRISNSDGFSWSTLNFSVEQSDLNPTNFSNGSGTAGQVLTVNPTSDGLIWASAQTSGNFLLQLTDANGNVIDNAGAPANWVQNGNIMCLYISPITSFFNCANPAFLQMTGFPSYVLPALPIFHICYGINNSISIPVLVSFQAGNTLRIERFDIFGLPFDSLSANHGIKGPFTLTYLV